MLKVLDEIFDITKLIRRQLAVMDVAAGINGLFRRGGPIVKQPSGKRIQNNIGLPAGKPLRSVIRLYEFHIRAERGNNLPKADRFIPPHIRDR